MSYWDEVKGVVNKGIDLAVENAKATMNTTVVAGRETILYFESKKELFFKQRELHSLLADLGNHAHKIYQSKGDFYTDEKIKQLISEIEKLEEACKNLEK